MVLRAAKVTSIWIALNAVLCCTSGHFGDKRSLDVYSQSEACIAVTPPTVQRPRII